MTGLTTAQLLAAGLVVVYLLDSMHFLCLDEAVLRTRGGRLAALSFGSGLELGGRRSFLPNPFTPHRPEFRLLLDQAAPPSADLATLMQACLAAVATLRWLSAACALLTAVVAPAALLTGSDPGFLLAAALTWTLMLLSAALALRVRAALGLGVAQILGTAVIALVCLPCAGNFTRALVARTRLTLGRDALLQLSLTDMDAAARRDALHAALVRLGEENA